MKDNGGKQKPERLLDALSGLLGEWREVASRCVDEAERFTREKPTAGLAAAFLAGIFLSSLLRRR